MVLVFINKNTALLGETCLSCLQSRYLKSFSFSCRRLCRFKLLSLPVPWSHADQAEQSGGEIRGQRPFCLGSKPGSRLEPGRVAAEAGWGEETPAASDPGDQEQRSKLQLVRQVRQLAHPRPHKFLELEMVLLATATTLRFQARHRCN